MLNKKEEARTLVKLGMYLPCICVCYNAGVMKNMNSHVCWHVYGILYRSDRDYAQAIRCYLNALKKDPENLQVLRDLAQLQAHMKDFDGLLVCTILGVERHVRRPGERYSCLSQHRGTIGCHSL